MQQMIFIATYCLTICACTIKAHAQTFSEWWRQKKTRIQYLEQQVAALESCKMTAEKGYQIAEDGIHNIEGIKEQEYNLHYTFFESQGILHPVIKYSPEVSGILALYDRLLAEMTVMRDYWSHDSRLDEEALEMLLNILNGERNTAMNNLQRLEELTKDKELKMLDADRMEIIHSIGISVDESLRDLHIFEGMLVFLTQESEEDEDDIDDLKHLFP